MSGLGIGVNPKWRKGSKAHFDSATSATQVKDIDISEADKLFIAGIRQQALALAFTFIDVITNNKEPEKSPSEILDELLLQAIGDNDDEDNDYYSVLLGAVGDAFSSLGVSDQLIDDALDEDTTNSDSALESIVETVIGNLPADGEPLEQFAEDFIYSRPDSVADYDSAGGAGAHIVKTINGKKINYTMTYAIRHGKKVLVNKRQAGQKVRLSQAQKASIKKMHLKSYLAKTQKLRVKSWKKGRKLGTHGAK